MKKSVKMLSTVVLALMLIVCFGGICACNHEDEPTKYTVSFSLGECTEGTAPAAQTVESGTSITLTSVSWSGHDFLGWDDGEKTYKAGESYTVTKDVTLTAKWQAQGEKEKFTVTFSLGECTEGTAPATQTVESGTSITLTSVSWSGHDFLGWDDGEKVYKSGESYTVVKDVTLTAKWQAQTPKDDITGKGTEEDPYVINTANGLVTFANNVNKPDESATADWYKANFKLGADIDMAGVSYNPAGSSAVEVNGTSTVLGFIGTFDGDGHTISNLTVTQNVRSTAYIGLFGFTNGAYIHDVNIENFKATAISGANTTDIIAYIGAVAGYLGMSQVDNIHASIDVKLQWLANNRALVGGIAGMFHSDGGFIVYAENVSATLNVATEKFASGSDVSVMEAVYGGGLFGEAYVADSSAAAIINCVTRGEIGGGQYVGGFIGAAIGDNLSIINGYANMALKTSSTEDGAVGGFIGVAEYDNTIMDSYAKATVTVSKNATVGGLVGIASEDSFDEVQLYGLAVVNSYYTMAFVGSSDNKYGDELDANFDKKFALETLKWDEKSWDFDKFEPTTTRARDINEAVGTVYLVDGTSKTQKTVGGSKNYGTIGVLESPENTDGNVFWDWQFYDGCDYRFYVPVVKDITLTAKKYDVSGIVAVYEGNSSYGEHNNQVGLLEFKLDGTIDWISSYTGTSTGGTYRYDGEHIIIERDDGEYICGSISKVEGKNVFTYNKNEGTGYDVVYTFTVAEDIPLFGEFFSEDGDIITISGSANITLIMDDVPEVLRATYTKDGDTLTISGVDTYYTSATITLAENSFTTDFKGKDGIKDNNKEFTRPTKPDYTGKEILGDYNTLYMYYNYQDARTVTLNADGSVESSFSSVPGKFYLFDDNKIKLIIDDQVSTFYFDARGFFYGIMNRGTTARSTTVLAPIDDGKLKGFIIDGNKSDVVFVNNKIVCHLQNGEIVEDKIEGKFEDGETVKIGDKSYVVTETYFESGENKKDAYYLTSVGAEMGDYSYNDKDFKLDGVGKASGEIQGNYVLIDDNVIVYNFTNGELYVFDYAEAQDNDGEITLAENDGYRGMYYCDKENTKGYYVLIIDGIEHAQVFYLKDGVYTGSFGPEWRTYTVKENGDVFVKFNDYQQPEFTFYYGNQLVKTHGTTNVLKDCVFYAFGYTGPTEIPTFDSSLAGTYTGEETTFTLNSDLTGTLNGSQFTARVDSENVLVFKLDGTVYTFDGDKLTLSHGETTVKLTKSEESEPQTQFPQGTWKGTLVTDNGNLNNQPIEVTFDAEDNVTLKFGSYNFEGNYTYTNNEIDIKDVAANSGAEFSFDKITIDGDKLTIKFSISDEYYDWGPHDYTAELTKEEASEPVQFPQGTWKGTLVSDNGALKNQPIEVTFDAQGKVTLKFGSYTFEGEYTYEDGKIEITNVEPTSSTEFTFDKITIDGDKLTIEFSITDEYGDWGPHNYTAELTK